MNASAQKWCEGQRRDSRTVPSFSTLRISFSFFLIRHTARVYVYSGAGPYTGGAGGPCPPRNLRSRFSHKGDPYDFGEILKFGGLGPPVIENWALPPPSLNPVYGPALGGETEATGTGISNGFEWHPPIGSGYDFD